jgi:RNA polymerase sigma factor (sigma-70 family)
LSQNYSTQQLVTLMIQKNQQGFDVIYDRYADVLYGVLLKIVNGKEAQAQHLLQETFTKIWNTIGEYDEELGSLFTWVLSIARNIADNFIRSQNINKLDSHFSDAITEENIIFRNYHELNGQNATIVAQLEKKYTEVLDLVYFKGFTYKEVADTLSISVAVVTTRMQFAIQQLRNTLNS